MSKKSYFSKRVKMIYVVILLWLLLGSLAAWYDTTWSQASWFFASLTTYVGTYIASETMKKSQDPTGLFPKSKRELVTYTCMAMWLIAGTYGIISKTDLTQLAAYFTALSGFIALYVLGQHLRTSGEPSATLPKLPKKTAETATKPAEEKENNEE